MRISLTGRISIETGGATLDEEDLPGRQLRLVLAYLIAEQGRPVPREELAEALWEEAPPATWEKALAVLMSKLRARLEECGLDGRAALRSAFGCYELVLPDDAWIDLVCARESAERAAVALATGDFTVAKRSAASAATLARRSFLPGEHGSWVEEKRRELQELLVRSLECLADACLQAGDAGEAVTHAEELIALEPFRESAYRRLMQAQAAAGNNDEALRTYERCRRSLAEELGAYPSPETEGVYLEILRATPSGKQSPAAPGIDGEKEIRPRANRRRLAALALAAAALAGALVAIVVVRSGGPGFLPRVEANAVAAIDARAARPRLQLPLASRPAALAAGGGFLWVAGEDGTLARIDPHSRALRTADLGRGIGGLAYARGSLWLTTPDERAVAQLDPATLKVVQTIAVGNGPAAIAVGAGGIWVANTLDGTVSRIDLTRGTVTLRVAVGERPAAIAAGAAGVWVAKQGGPSLVRLDPRSGAIIAAIDVGNPPNAVVLGDRSVWVASREGGTISRIDPASDSVTATIAVGPYPSGLAIGTGVIWVARSDGTVLRIDSAEPRIDASASLESSPNALAYADGRLWVTTVPSLASHRGGVLRVEATPLLCPCGDPGGAGFNIPVTNIAYDGLVSYRRVVGVAGGEIVPDLAARLPTLSDGGRTFSFRLRPGIRYSNGTLVRASDFRSSLERLLTMNRGQPTNFDAVVGAEACDRIPSRCHLSRGIEADDAAGTVTIHLTRADPDFLSKLVGLAAVPSGTPIQRGRERPVPGTGPYRVASVSPSAVRLTRNPYFHVWSRDARPDGYPAEIRFRFSDDPATRLASLRRGEGDWVTSLPAGWIGRLLARYGARIHTDPAPSTDFMFLNASVPPFDDVRVRQALNYAVDRRTIVELAGGPLVAQPACQLLPPAIPGYRPHCRYTVAGNEAGAWTAPDIARAKALVAASGTRGMKVRVFAYEAGGRLERVYYARYFASLLRRLGYRSTVRVISNISEYVDYVGDSRNQVQIGAIGWTIDSASGFLHDLFSCASFLRDNPRNRNLSQFCDRRVDETMSRAAAAQAVDSVRATRLWAQVDQMLTARAAAVPLIHRSAVVLVSKRVGNYQYNPQLGTLLDQLWVK